jgi:hypothetical protein
MQLVHLERYLEDELTYPIDLASVVDAIGSVEIESPNEDDSETVAAVLRPLGDDTYDSPGELFEAIVGNLSEEYVGRKFYDDRGGNPPGEADEPSDDVNVSF